MNPYLELRQQLVQRYPNENNWRLAAEGIGLDPGAIVLQGSAIAAWSNILRAVRTSGRMKGLHDFLKYGDEDLLSRFDDYAALLARGEATPLDLPDLTSVVLADAVLTPDSVRYSLESGGPFRAFGANDLIGSNTSAARLRLDEFEGQLARELAMLDSRRRQIASQRTETESRIGAIRRAARPQMPAAPTPNPAWSVEQQASQQRQYDDRLAEYRRATAAYEAGLSSLGPLQDKVEAWSREMTEIDARMEGQRTAGETSRRQFRADIDAARDRDMLHELDLALERTMAAFHADANPFKGFCSLLGADVMLGVIVKSATQAATATEARGRFEQAAEGLTRQIDDAKAAIAAPCLAAPIVISRLLATNRATIAALAERLAKLPLERLEERRGQMQSLIDLSIVPVPDFSKHETEANLEAARQQATVGRAATEAMLATARSQVATEPPDLKTAIAAAQAAAKATVDGIETIAKANGGLLDHARSLWTLIREGAGSVSLPAEVQRLCEALPPECERRINMRASEVMALAVDTDLALKDAQAMVQTHLVTRYVTAQTALDARIDALDARRNELEQASAGIDQRYEKVAAEVGWQLRTMSHFSFVPIGNLITPFWGITIVRRLAKLVPSSTVPPYEALGHYAFTTFERTAWACGLLAAIMIAFTSWAYLAKAFPDGTPVSLAFTIAFVVAFAVSINNLRVFNAHMRTRPP
jgi:hypothetical protein